MSDDFFSRLLHDQHDDRDQLANRKIELDETGKVISDCIKICCLCGERKPLCNSHLVAKFMLNETYNN